MTSVKDSKLKKGKASILLLLIVFFFCLIMSSDTILSATQSKIRVALIPFKMNVSEELKYLREGIMDMLSTRLTQGADILPIENSLVKKAVEEIHIEITEEVARKIGNNLGADYVVFGSITKVMESLSIDGKVVKVKSEEPAIQVFTQSSGMDNVIIKISEFSQNLQNAILGKPLITIPLFQPPPQMQALSQYPQIETQTPPPEYFISRKRGRSAEEEEETLVIQPSAARRAQRFWRSQLFETEIWGMDIGDVNGDKENEIVMIETHSLNIYKKATNNLELIKRLEGPFYEKYLNVDVADINKNGIDEIFVTCIKEEFLESFIVEFDQEKKEYRRIVSKIPWFLKVIDLPGEGLILLGQKTGTDQAFSGDIYKLTYKNGKVVPEQRYYLPRGVNLYGFNQIDLEKTGEQDILYIDENEYLRVVSTSGELKWKSDEPYGGSDKYFERNFDKEASSEKNISKKKIYVQPRILVKDTNNDNEKEVIIGRNESQTGRIFKDTRFYNRSEIQNLIWNGISFVENWRTKKIDGYLSDFQIKDVDNDGDEELVVAVILRYDIMQLKLKSAVLVYELKSKS